MQLLVVKTFPVLLLYLTCNLQLLTCWQRQSPTVCMLLWEAAQVSAYNHLGYIVSLTLHSIQDHLAKLYKAGGRKPITVQTTTATKYKLTPPLKLTADGVVVTSLIRSMQDPLYQVCSAWIRQSRTMS